MSRGGRTRVVAPSPFGTSLCRSLGAMNVQPTPIYRRRKAFEDHQREQSSLNYLCFSAPIPSLLFSKPSHNHKPFSSPATFQSAIDCRNKIPLIVFCRICLPLSLPNRHFWSDFTTTTTETLFPSSIYPSFRSFYPIPLRTLFNRPRT